MPAKRRSKRYDNRPIGLFDSGLGGLTVVRAVREALPGEDVIYLGDTARVPYGNRSPEEGRSPPCLKTDYPTPEASS